jgi:hypothetical protein
VRDPRHLQDTLRASVLDVGEWSAECRSAHFPLWPIRVIVVLIAAGCAGDAPDKVAPIRVIDSGNEQPDASDAAVSVPKNCLVTPTFLLDYKRCSVDADCAVVSYRAGCCKPLTFAGVASSDADYVSACAAQASKTCHACDDSPSRAEDGRYVPGDASNVAATCVDNACRTRVTMRQCGSQLHCAPTELCVTYEHNAQSPDKAPPSSGGNSLITYVCAPNPCDGELDCNCAKDLCDQDATQPRHCEIQRNDQSDVACVPYLD